MLRLYNGGGHDAWPLYHPHSRPHLVFVQNRQNAFVGLKQAKTLSDNRFGALGTLTRVGAAL